MRRSERYFREAAYFFLQGTAFVVAGIACAIWGYSFLLDRNWLFIGFWILALNFAFFGVTSVIEARRLHNLSKDEEYREKTNLTRPRI